MRIAVDAMGGDYAPDEIVKGVAEFAPEFDGQLILVGDSDTVKSLLKKYSSGKVADNIEVQHASEIIEMGEHPASAVHKKKDSSIVVANRLVKQGRADAVVSAGSTGAAMTASLFAMGRIRGIDRPGILGSLPNTDDRTYIVDMGALVDSKPNNLLQFALMGDIFARQVAGMDNPRIGLLSNGSEESKGNELVQAAYVLLKEQDINFIGNVEGRDIFNGSVDLVVCDGFTGNCVLKTAEGLAIALVEILKKELSDSKMASLGAAMMYKKLKPLKKKIDYAEYGGAPLLGINGVSIIAHGSSKALAVKRSIAVAAEAVEQDLVGQIRQNVCSVKGGQLSENDNTEDSICS